MNYREEKITGEITQWTRANQISISNPLGGIPSITFNETCVKTLPDGEQVVNQCGEITETFENPLEEITLLHPLTDQVLGEASYQDLQVMLYSLYIQLAKKRDEEISA